MISFTMVWNPFQYQFSATYVSDEGDKAVIELRKGATIEVIHLSKTLLPAELEAGASFFLKLEDNETVQSSELETLKLLLSNLIQ